jgi:threonine synthase
VNTDHFSSSRLLHLYCARCGKKYPANQLQSYAQCCNQPLYSHYDFSGFSAKNINRHIDSIWRYRQLLPVLNEANIISLNEGWTPLQQLFKLEQKLGQKKILLKDEAGNPTGSFKARGLSVAVSKLKELGVEHCIIPTAGNAGGALSAYAAKANMQATVVMPRHSAETLKEECRLYGATLILVDGLIDACGRKVAALKEQNHAFDISTMKEPYRLEGKKTIGYEIAEQHNWVLPDVIIYPTGGGTGLLGMWKAFKEMQLMGMLSAKLPRMVIVQSEKCNPMIQQFETGRFPETYLAEPSLALGLSVPAPFAKDIIQEIVKESRGTAISCSENEISSGITEFANTEGILLSPEGAAGFIGLKKLIEKDYLKEDETVLLFNTGSWYKYR